MSNHLTTRPPTVRCPRLPLPTTTNTISSRSLVALSPSASSERPVVSRAARLLPSRHLLHLPPSSPRAPLPPPFRPKRPIERRSSTPRRSIPSVTAVNCVLRTVHQRAPVIVGSPRGPFLRVWWCLAPQSQWRPSLVSSNLPCIPVRRLPHCLSVFLACRASHLYLALSPTCTTQCSVLEAASSGPERDKPSPPHRTLAPRHRFPLSPPPRPSTAIMPPKRKFAEVETAPAVPPSLPPSVEEAYRRKCVQLKNRTNEVEDANDAARLRLARIKRQVEKLRIERAFLLEQLAKRTSTNVEDSEGSPSPPPTVCQSQFPLLP